jgi:HemY protein
MSTVLWILVLAALAVATALLTTQGGGFVLLVIPPWRIELSIAAFVIGLMLLMVAGFLVTRLTAGTLGLPMTIRALRLGRRRAKAREAVLQAVLAFFEGDYARAEQAAAQALQQGESVGLCAVVAARAAHAQRRFEARDGYLETLHSLMPADRVIQLTTQADLLLDERRPQEALEVLRGARDIAPRSSAVRRLTLRAQMRMRQWDQVLLTLAALEKAGAIDRPHAEAVRRQCNLELLDRHGQDERSLRTFWRSFGAQERTDRAVVLAAASRFMGLKLMDDAREIVENALEHQWDTELAALYGQCTGSAVLSQIERAERWLQKHPQDAGLLLSLGRLCLHQSLWGKAQNYLEASMALDPSHDGRQLLERLREELAQRAPSPDLGPWPRRLPPDFEGG